MHHGPLSLGAFARIDLAVRVALVESFPAPPRIHSLPGYETTTDTNTMDGIWARAPKLPCGSTWGGSPRNLSVCPACGCGLYTRTGTPAAGWCLVKDWVQGVKTVFRRARPRELHRTAASFGICGAGENVGFSLLGVSGQPHTELGWDVLQPVTALCTWCPRNVGAWIQGPGLTWDGSFQDFGLIPSSSSLLLLSWCSVRDTRTGREKRMVRDWCDPEPLNPQISCSGRASNPRSISEDPPPK